MKILSYNINGLKAFRRTNKFDQVMSDFNDIDIYCFQEVKCNDDKVFESIKNDYPNNIISTNINEYYKGYAGVMCIKSKDIEDPVVYEVNFCLDNLYYSDGRIVKYKFNDFYLLNVYVPNSGNKEELRKQWDKEFCEYIQSLDKPVIICGDFNVCSTELDYWGNYKKSINTSPGLMDFEISGFDNLCKACNLIDAYRYVNKNNRKYSWYSQRNRKSIEKNQGWRLDYFLVSPELVDKIKSCDIISPYQGADHSPIILDIDL